MTTSPSQDSKFDSAHSWYVTVDELATDPLVSGLFTAEDFDTLFDTADTCLNRRIFYVGIVHETPDGSEVAVELFDLLTVVSARALWLLHGGRHPLSFQ